MVTLERLLVIGYTDLSPEELSEFREAAVAEVLSVAGSMPRGDWNAYSKCKQMVAGISLTPTQHDNTIQRLVEVLGL